MKKRCCGAAVLRCAGAVVLVFLSAAGASAQGAPALRAHRVVLDGGADWSGGYAIGSTTVQLRGNALGSNPPPFTLLTASSEVGRATTVSLRVGITLTSRWLVEVGGSFGAPRVGVTISHDVEAGAQRLAGEQLKQYLIDSAVLWHLPVRLGTRVRPFVIAGGGYLRQLHEERTLVETGQVYYGGLGARYWLRGGTGVGRALGVRGDVRATVRRGGIDFEDRTRVFPTVAVHLFVTL